MKSNISIRPLQSGDGAFLCSIFKDNRQYYQIFHDPEARVSAWEQRVNRFIQQDQINHCIITSDDTSVGWLSYYDAEADEREIGILVIKAEFLSLGYGAAALCWLIEKRRKEHKSSLVLNVNQDNKRAIRFYRQFGFVIIGQEIIPQCNDAIDLAQYKMKLDL